MGSKKEAGRARRRWEATIAPAEQALVVIDAFLTGVASYGPLQNSPAAQATLRTVQSWKRNHSTIYTVDRDLQYAVTQSGVPNGFVPGEIFDRLPHQTPLFLLPHPITVDDPDANTRIHYNMFFANRTEDHVLNSVTGKFLPDKRPMLRFVWFGADDNNPNEYGFTTASIHVTENIDLKESLLQILEEIPSHAGNIAKMSKAIRGDNWNELNEALFPVAAMLTLYTCSQTPDLVAVKIPQVLRGSRKTKNYDLEVHSLGFRVGEALRAAHTPSGPPSGIETSQRTVAPHLRKAHWHRFWTGPRSSPAERKLVLRWIPPVAVNITKGSIAPTVHPIRSNNQHLAEE